MHGMEYFSPPKMNRIEYLKKAWNGKFKKCKELNFPKICTEWIVFRNARNGKLKKCTEWEVKKNLKILISIHAKG
jgi:hypothetical protein